MLLQYGSENFSSTFVRNNSFQKYIFYYTVKTLLSSKERGFVA